MNWLGIPLWLWGVFGGLALGPIGLGILWGGCSRGAVALMKRFVISVLVKLVIAGIGFWIAIKKIEATPDPLVYGFLVGYLLSLILEISICLWKVRRCASLKT